MAVISNPLLVDQASAIIFNINPLVVTLVLFVAFVSSTALSSLKFDSEYEWFAGFHFFDRFRLPVIQRLFFGEPFEWQ